MDKQGRRPVRKLLQLSRGERWGARIRVVQLREVKYWIYYEGTIYRICQRIECACEKKGGMRKKMIKYPLKFLFYNKQWFSFSYSCRKTNYFVMVCFPSIHPHLFIQQTQQMLIKYHVLSAVLGM